ncbi:hypothetical protein F5Y05DRAFT_412311 [Hypoxylon sp. FL0543]|nr:hypothetical protein F5Y05DRAFT_412311 [Hypoxylon sp. FL0543]
MYVEKRIYNPDTPLIRAIRIGNNVALWSLSQIGLWSKVIDDVYDPTAEKSRGDPNPNPNPEVTLYTHGNKEFADELTPLTKAAKNKFHIDSRLIKRFINERFINDNGNSLTVEFTDGSSNAEKFLVHHPKTEVNGGFFEQLGLALTPLGDIEATAPFFQTSVRGVFAAGDAITLYKVVNRNRP